MEAFASTGPASALNEFQRSLEFGCIYRKEPKGWIPRDGIAACFRILSWNIERGYDPAQLAETIRKLQPDIACLQEVDWGNERTGRRDVLQELADQTGMLGLFGIEFLELASSARTRRLAGGGATGNALLCRVEPNAIFRLGLTTPFDWAHDADNSALPARVRRRLRRERRIGQRFGVGAEFAVGSRKLIACSVHFEDKFGGVSARLGQFRSAADAIGAREGADKAMAIIAGDFNTFDSRLARLRSGDTSATALGRPPHVSEAEWWKRRLLPPTGFCDPFDSGAWTFCVPPLFRAKLDWIAIRNGVAYGRGVGAFSSSDHRPIWADMAIRG